MFDHIVLMSTSYVSFFLVFYYLFSIKFQAYLSQMELPFDVNNNEAIVVGKKTLFWRVFRMKKNISTVVFFARSIHWIIYEYACHDLFSQFLSIAGDCVWGEVTFWHTSYSSFEKTRWERKTPNIVFLFFPYWRIVRKRHALAHIYS